jgi:hypothetical protein
MRNVSNDVEKKNTHFMFNNFSPKNLAVYKIMWKKHGTARQVTDDSVARALRVLDN